MTWLSEPIAWLRRQRETRGSTSIPARPPTTQPVAAAPLPQRCRDCGRNFIPPGPRHGTTCWWCASYADEPDPYLDLGGGD